MSLPSEKSKIHARKLGYEPWVVERFLAHAGEHGTRVDLFGLADLELWAHDHTLYVQACRRGDFHAHRNKAEVVMLPRLSGDDRPPASSLRLLVATPARWFEIWAWGHKGKGTRWRLERFRAMENGDGFSWVGVDPDSGPVFLRGTLMDVQPSLRGAPHLVGLDVTNSTRR